MSNAIKWKELGAELESAPAHFLKSVELERVRRQEARKEAREQKRRNELLEKLRALAPDLAAHVDDGKIDVDEAWVTGVRRKEGWEYYRRKVAAKLQEIERLSLFLEQKSVTKLACDIVRDLKPGSEDYISIFLGIGFCIENLQHLEKSLLGVNQQMIDWMLNT